MKTTEEHVTLGEQLAAARKKAGLSVDELSAKTRIRPGMLSAMEADDFSRCGGNFYARGHLRSLAKELGADGEALVAEYNAQHAAPEAQPTRREERAEVKPPTVRRARPRWAVLLGAILVALLGWGMVRLFTLPDDNQATATGSSPTPSVTTPTPTAPVTPSAPVTPTATPKPTSVRLTLVADHDGTYVTMRNYYGKRLFSGSLTKGVQQTLVYKGMILVTIEQPRNVRTYVNGQRVYPKAKRYNVLLDGTIEKRE
ncbi:MAG TPA: helix-turn-helix domain-containing protein [Kribbellaceae bacterium]